jgi:CRP/FNR family cyclic AMP-dependent transcriptional regulator
VAQISPTAAALSINPLFSGLASDDIQRIADLCVSLSLAKGQILFSKGQPGDALYGIRRGRVLIRTSNPAGKQHTIAVYGSGDIFGEIAMLDGRPRTADAVAGSPVELFAFRRVDFTNLISQKPNIAMNVIELLCARLRATSNRLEEATLLSLAPRLALGLLRLADDFGEEIPISQEELSDMVGATREAVNRQLQMWHRSGIIDLKRSLIQIVSLARLQAETLKEA